MNKAVKFSQFVNKLLLVALIVELFAGPIPVHAVPGDTTRISVDSNGIEGTGNSFSPAISSDGRYVAFQSESNNLVSGDTGGLDIFIRDTQTTTTSLISKSSSGIKGNLASSNPSISADGHIIAFRSQATNLVANDTNGKYDIFVHNTLTGTTVMASVDSSGEIANNHSWNPSVSADGRYVTFYSSASNLVSNDTNNTDDVFVFDLQTNTTTRVSVSSDGVEGNSYSRYPSISGDGRYIAFTSSATNLAPGGNSGIFLRDTLTGETTQVATSSANGPSISSDGRYVAFSSNASNLVTGDTNSAQDIFRYDIQTDAIIRVSVDSNGTEGNDNSYPSNAPIISSDGRFVVFYSSATNLVDDDSNSVDDVFLRDIYTGTTTRISLDSNGVQGNGTSQLPVTSSDAGWVAFESVSTNLVSDDANGKSDIFLMEFEITPLYSISGKVTDTNNNPVAGVDISDDQGHTTTTDANGDYILSDLPSGDYVITPGQGTSGFKIFSPEDRDVTIIDNNINDQDFTAAVLIENPSLVSVDSNGIQGNGYSIWPDLSSDGRYISFRSFSSNLVEDDMRSFSDIFVRDMQTGTTTLVSKNSDGIQGNQENNFPAISPDGLHIAFLSNSDNYAVGDSNLTSDVFLHDLLAGTTNIASVSSGGIFANDNSTYFLSVSANGRYVLFRSSATNLVSGDTNNVDDIFIHDTLTDSTTRVSVSSSGAQGDYFASHGSISYNGRYVAFASMASNLGPLGEDDMPFDTNGTSDIFLRDTATGTTNLLSISYTGEPANNWSQSPDISSNGRYIVFYSIATNLTEGDTNSASDIFWLDTYTGTMVRVSVNSNGIQGNGDSGNGGEHPTVSDDGRFVAFTSSATNLVDDDTNGVDDVFVRDVYAGTTTRVSVTLDGVEGNGDSNHPVISGDGKWVVFVSDADNLVVGDTNGVSDIFLKELNITPLYSISGQITDGDGNPISGVTVSDDHGHLATTDDIGDYVLSNLPSGDYVITPSQGSSIFSSFSPDWRSVTIVDESVTVQDFVANELYSISGMVHDRNDNPVAGVIVSDNHGHIAITGSNGKYQLSNLPSGDYVLSLSQGTSAFSGFDPDFSVAQGAAEINITLPTTDVSSWDFTADYLPVLIVPGIAGTYAVDTSNDMTWLLNRGIGPASMTVDPLAHVYDDLIQTLKNAGYVEGKNLFVVLYDWRLHPAPIDGVFDGHISGLTAASIADSNFQTGVDYLGFYLDFATTQWQSDHPGQSLGRVDVVAHSTGGIIARAYIQSDAYGGLYDGVNHLPMINNLIMVGVPNRGASKAWNPLHDDWTDDVAYSFVLSKIMNRAYQKMIRGYDIVGPDYIGQVLTKDYPALLDGGGSPDPKKFIQLYVPTMRGLLATYNFLDLGNGNGFVNLNDDPAQRNDLLLDLNNGYDSNSSGNPNEFTSPLLVKNVTVIYGAGLITQDGIKVSTAPQPDQFGVSPAEVTPFTSFNRRTLPGGETWYINKYGQGDGTVPVISSKEQFVNCNCVSLKEISNETHTGLMSNIGVQLIIEDILGINPLNNISTGLAETGLSGVLSAISDPVEFILSDGQGRRFGYTTATGPLTEIPGSIWYGGSDGAGWIFGAIQEPVTTQLNGLNESYYVMVSNKQANKNGGIVLTGEVLEDGSSITSPLTLEDVTIPSVQYVGRFSDNPSNKSSVDFTVAFSEDVTGVDTSAPYDDFVLIVTGVAGAHITNVSGSGNIYTVTVNTGSGNGTIRLDIDDNDSIFDTADNPLGGMGADNGDFTIGEMYIIDKTISDLISPVDMEAATSLQPTFDWSDVTDALSYNIQISKDDTFKKPILNATTLSSLYFPVKDLPRNTLLYWRIRAKTTSGLGNWSDVHTFTTSVNPPPAPVLISPKTKALVTDYTPLLVWKPIILPEGTNFQNYIIQVDDDPFFSNPEVDASSIMDLNTTEFEPGSALDFNTTYYWRVRAVNTDDELGGWSKVFNFRTALLPPTLVSPVDGFASLELRPPFDWDDDPNANGYLIQISTTADFARPILKGNAKTSLYIPTNDLPKGVTLFWRVQTKPAKGSNGPSDWSEVRSLTTPVNPPPAPILLSPKNNALTTDYTPLFTWKPIIMPLGTDFQNYIIQVDDDPLFGSPEVDDSRITDINATQLEPSSDLDANTKYYWRVRSVNTDGELSNWSTKTLYFRTAILPPTLLTPADMSTVGSSMPTLDWEDVTDANGYTIQISTSPTCSTTLVKATTVISTYTPVIDMPAGQTIYWCVQAKPAKGSNGPSEWSEVFNFLMP